MLELKDNPKDVLQSWSREEKEKLLALLAADLLQHDMERPFAVVNSEQKPIAYLYPAFDPAHEFGGGYSLAYFFELQRRALTIEDAVPWSEFRSLLSSDLDLERPKS